MAKIFRKSINPSLVLDFAAGLSAPPYYSRRCQGCGALLPWERANLDGRGTLLVGSSEHTLRMFESVSIATLTLNFLPFPFRYPFLQTRSLHIELPEALTRDWRCGCGSSSARSSSSPNE
jgi:hypothetical protein